MNLRELKIESASYGPNKGKLTAKILVGDDQGHVYVDLPPETAAKIMFLAADEIVAATGRAANDFRDRLMAAVSDAASLLPPPIPT